MAVRAANPRSRSRWARAARHCTPGRCTTIAAGREVLERGVDGTGAVICGRATYGDSLPGRATATGERTPSSSSPPPSPPRRRRAASTSSSRPARGRPRARAGGCRRQERDHHGRPRRRQPVPACGHGGRALDPPGASAVRRRHAADRSAPRARRARRRRTSRRRAPRTCATASSASRRSSPRQHRERCALRVHDEREAAAGHVDRAEERVAAGAPAPSRSSASTSATAK